MGTMKDDSKDKKAKGEEHLGSGPEDFDLDLDDIDEELIDLVDVVEGEDEALDDEPYGEGRPAEDMEGEPFALDDLDLDIELAEESPGLDPVIEPIEERADAATEALAEAEGEIEEMLRGEETATEAVGEECGEVATDDVLAELFESDEMDVSKLLDEAGVPGPEVGEALTEEEEGIEEEFPDELFADLEAEEGPIGEEAEALEQASVAEEIPDEFLVEVEKRTGVPAQKDEVSQLPAASVEELAELVREQVEAVVKSLAEERLPAIVERIIAEEIEKIKASMD
jgi:hypothetical protein